MVDSEYVVVPCQPSTAMLRDVECREYLSQLIGWRIEVGTNNQTDYQKLTKVYRFSHFLSAFEFASRVAELAEKEGHHPSSLVEWGSVTVSWWTHPIGGLHHNDFIMVAKSDTL